MKVGAFLNKKTISYILFFLIFSAIIYLGVNEDVHKDKRWYDESVICHALGYIDCMNRTNSKESFLYNYDKVGMRLFEIDLIVTSDNELVLSHNFDPKRQPDIDSDGAPSLEKFMNTPIFDKYTPLSFRQLLKLMETRPDSYFIIDPKMDSYQCYSQMLEVLEEEGKSEYIDRFVVQVFNEDELVTFKESFPYSNYLFASFNRGVHGTLDFIKLCSFCKKYGVQAFLTKEEYWKPYYSIFTDFYNITSYAHVTNEISKAMHEMELNYDGFYTDSINQARWYDDKLIAHALGGINEDKNTNSKEAMLHNYHDLGMRVFEVDFMSSSDGDILLTHEFEDERQPGILANGTPSTEYFLSIPAYGKYTPMTIEDLFEVMEECPGCYMMTDVKDDSMESVVGTLSAIVAKAREVDKEYLLDAFIIQFYHEDQISEIKKLYPFKNFVYTLYRTDFDESPEQFRHNVAFCKKNGVDVITVRKAWWHKEFAKIKDKYGVKVFLHTINDIDLAEKYYSEGVDGLYTDFITHEDLAAEYQ